MSSAFRSRREHARSCHPVDSLCSPTVESVLQVNRAIYEELDYIRELRIVDGAGHLFEGPGELKTVAEHASEWFRSLEVCFRS